MSIASPPLPTLGPPLNAGPNYYGRELSIEDFLAIPHDGVSRRLVDGIVTEEGGGVAYRNRIHSRVMTRVAVALENWSMRLPSPLGSVYTGDVGAIFERQPRKVAVGIDVAFFSTAVIDRQSATTRVFDGVPDLAVEILSPSDNLEVVEEKIELYLEYGVPHLWIVNARFRNVTVYRPGIQPQLCVGDDVLRAEPQLPGFAVKTSDLFS